MEEKKSRQNVFCQSNWIIGIYQIGTRIVAKLFLTQLDLK